jgi:Mycothiol maleylpyruvate isomerase N-terminal domain
MTTYAELIDVLEAELGGVCAVFAELDDRGWATPTLLVPVDPALPHWTVFELAGHLDISMGLARMLVEGRDPSLQPARDRTSFFINPRSETGPAVYQYAYTMVEGRTPATMAGHLSEQFAGMIAAVRGVPEDTVGPGYFAAMRADEFVASRIVEAVVHGLDLTQPLGRSPVATAKGIAVTAAILDDLLARRTLGTRPAALTDDLEWVTAASGRAAFTDSRLPLIG